VRGRLTQTSGQSRHYGWIPDCGTLGTLLTEDQADPVREDSQPPVAVTPIRSPAERLVALFEALLCSGFPTQLALGATLIAVGVGPQTSEGTLSLKYVVALSLIDTVCVFGLVLIFLSAHDESARRVLLGHQSLAREMRAGMGLTFVAFLLAVVVLAFLQAVAPGLHTVEENPLKDLMRTPQDAALFGVVVVFAGGVREEIQRAFLMHRFGGWLGGVRTGIVVSSILFGAGHLPQGIDAAIATGVLGAFWALVYVRRRSAVAPMVSHAGFNLLQLAQFLVIGR
jgi:membrane protease YdiL (CAAX protease family)